VEGKTILLATHNLAEAEELCDKVVIMHMGKIVAMGSPEELRKHFSNTIRIVTIKFKSNRVPPDTEYLNSVNTFVTAMTACGYFFSVCDKKECITLQLPPQSALNDVIKELYKSRLSIQTINVKDTSLEEVFLKLTRVVN
jgi:ABC-type multidrug transport system ATPase subunit